MTVDKHSLRSCKRGLQLLNQLSCANLYIYIYISPHLVIILLHCYVRLASQLFLPRNLARWTIKSVNQWIIWFWGRNVVLSILGFRGQLCSQWPIINKKPVKELHSAKNCLNDFFPMPWCFLKFFLSCSVLLCMWIDRVFALLVNFFPLHCTLWDSEYEFFSLHAASAIVSFLDTLHPDMWHLNKKFYCRTANSKVDAVTANLWLVWITTGSDKPWSSILDNDPISVRTWVLSAGIFLAI